MALTFRAEPDLTQWASLAHTLRTCSFAGRSLDDWRSTTRTELGLPTDHTIIGTGHQAGFWHPGILAKFIAADRIVESLGRQRATAVHLVVDQDDNDPRVVDAPVSDEEGTLRANVVCFLEPGKEGSPTGSLPPQRAAASENIRTPLDSVRNGLASMRRTLDAHVDDSRSLADQCARAAADLMRPWVRPMPLIFASDLLSTSLGRAIIDAMRARSSECADAYNAAAREHPESGIAELVATGNDIELPLWRIDSDGLRHRCFASELPATPLDELRPRAILMTAIVRLAVCDLFVHGTGGIAYDRVMEAWLGEWLDLVPARAAMATADVYLPLRSDAQLPMTVDHAISAKRALWHDPAIANGRRAAHPSETKQQFLAEIADAPRNSTDRRDRFREMHDWLARARQANASAVEAADRDLADARRYAAERAIIERRTWAFPLYPREEIDALADSIGRLATIPA